MKKIKSFTKDNYNKEEPIIIYGASVYGEIAYYALKEMGILPDYYCDQAKEKQFYFDIPVIRLENLKKMPKANVIIASADYYNEIAYSLEEVNVEVFHMKELLNSNIPEEKLSNRAKEMYANRQHYMDIVHNRESNNDLVLNRVQFVVSERCSLKCRDCTHLMQYYRSPKDIILEEYREAFDLLLDTVSTIAEIRILGGEPFMNKDMYKVIDWYHDRENIQSISVYTNGTIIPNETILKSLQKKKVKVHISNYGINREKVGALVDVLKRYNIVFFERKYDAWQDAGNLDFRGYSIDYMKQIFSHCFERNCLTFLKGQLHRCPRSAHAMNIGAMEIEKKDFVDLLHWKEDKRKLAEEIKNLLKKEYIEVCNYCDGPNNHMQSIQPAIQIKEPLVYRKIGE